MYPPQNNMLAAKQNSKLNNYPPVPNPVASSLYITQGMSGCVAQKQNAPPTPAQLRQSRNVAYPGPSQAPAQSAAIDKGTRQIEFLIESQVEARVNAILKTRAPGEVEKQYQGILRAERSQSLRIFQLNAALRDSNAATETRLLQTEGRLMDAERKTKELTTEKENLEMRFAQMEEEKREADEATHSTRKQWNAEKAGRQEMMDELWQKFHEGGKEVARLQMALKAAEEAKLLAETTLQENLDENVALKRQLEKAGNVEGDLTDEVHRLRELSASESKRAKSLREQVDVKEKEAELWKKRYKEARKAFEKRVQELEDFKQRVGTKRRLEAEPNDPVPVKRNKACSSGNSLDKRPLFSKVVRVPADN